MYRTRLTWLIAFLMFIAFSAKAEDTVDVAEDSTADDSPTATELDSSTYILAYQFEPGEEIRYKVEHRATVDTKIDGDREVSKSRSASTRVWTVESVDVDKFTFVQMIEDVDMWQKADGRDEVRFNSTKDKEVPAQYKHVVKTLGQPLATITVDNSGREIKRESKNSNPDLGFGGILVPLPRGEVTVGHTWTSPKTVKVKHKDGRPKQVKLQLKYRLEKVSVGVATISVKTEVLTAINDATLKSQLVQQLSNGKIRFDLDRGRMLSKVLEWTETVIGFNGAASNMKYLAKFNEDLLEAKTAMRVTSDE